MSYEDKYKLLQFAKICKVKAAVPVYTLNAYGIRKV
jgi:hypothetical protein